MPVFGLDKQHATKRWRAYKLVCWLNILVRSQDKPAQWINLCAFYEFGIQTLELELLLKRSRSGLSAEARPTSLLERVYRISS